MYHLSHCMMRMRHRYGLDMDAADYDSFCDAFASGKAQSCRTDSHGRVEGWLQFKGTWVCMSYLPAERFVGTVMPCPPPLVLEEAARHAARSAAKPAATPAWLRDEEEVNRRVSERAKSMAYSLFEGAVNGGKVPKWLQKKLLEGEATARVSARMRQDADAYAEAVRSTKDGMCPETRKADVSWFKRKINEARGLLWEGRVLDAACLLDGVSALAGSFKPSREPERAEELVRQQAERNRRFVVERFKANGLAQFTEG